MLFAPIAFGDFCWQLKPITKAKSWRGPPLRRSSYLDAELQLINRERDIEPEAAPISDRTRASR
jgi:hypothetical protein